MSSAPFLKPISALKSLRSHLSNDALHDRIRYAHHLAIPPKHRNFRPCWSLPPSVNSPPFRTLPISLRPPRSQLSSAVFTISPGPLVPSPRRDLSCCFKNLDFLFRTGSRRVARSIPLLVFTTQSPAPVNSHQSLATVLIWSSLQLAYHPQHQLSTSPDVVQPPTGISPPVTSPVLQLLSWSSLQLACQPPVTSSCSFLPLFR